MSYLMERDASRRGNIPLPTPSQPTSSASASSDKSSVNTLPLAANNVTNDVTPGQPGLHPSNDVQPFEMDQVPHPSNDVQGFEMDPPVGVPEHFQPRYSTELKKDLEEKHTNMIAFSAVVGIGFFLQAGRVTYLAGPGLAWIAYILMGTALWSAMASLGEMTALFPVKGAVFEFPSRFVDEGIGYACGWMSWFAWVVIVAAEVTAVAELFDFKIDPSYLQHFNYPLGYTINWDSTENISPAVFVALWLFFILFVNLLRVRWYGEIEYWIGVTKMVFFVGLILFNVINNARTKTFFRYYQEPYGFESKGFTSSRGEFHQGGSAHFAGMGTAMIVTIFSMIGFETVAITAPENKDLETEESIKLATRKISLRIILLYTLGVFVVGLNVPYDDPQLVDTSVSALNDGAHSIFVIAAVRDGVRGFPSFFNGFFIFSATSAGLNALYISSRLLHALANVPAVWPSWPVAQSIRRRLERTTDSGVPAAAVLTSWIFGWLGMLATRPNTSQILGRMATNSTVSILIVYTIICGAFLRFYQCTKNAVRDIEPPYLNSQQDRTAYDREDKIRYPYKSHWQCFRAVYGMVVCSIMVFFNGWRSIPSPLKGSDFVASYISIFIFLFLVAAYHVKIDNTWNPLKWSWRGRVSLDLSNPQSVYRPDPRRRRGKLHRQDPDRFLSRRNGQALWEWILVWLR